MTNRDEIRRQLDTDGVKYLLTQFVDIHGAAKVKLVPVASFDDVVDSGAGFAGGALNGMGQGPHSHDMLAKIDLDTYTPLPWDPEVARFASDLFVDDLPHPYCPRQNMKRILNSARERGFVFKVGIEPEHFLVTRTGKNEISIWDPSDTDSLEKPCYDFKGISGAMGYLREMMDGLNGLGWGVYQSDHEDANGQFEINFHYDDALVTEDRYTFFKMMTSQVARKFGAIATHMPKPFSNRTGSAGHIHFHVADVNTGNNLFLDMDDPRGLGLSQAAYHFIGGILDHAPALCAVNSPTVNCYNRLQVGSALLGSRSGFTWTPAFISYGDNNRTQMIRTAGPGHLEERTMSSGCNPYLAFSAYLNAGLDGIDRKLDPGEPFLGNLYDLGLDKIQQSGIRLLPQTLKEAILELKSDSVIQDALGPIYEEFTALKEQEWRDYHRQVSDWEIDRYLTLF